MRPVFTWNLGARSLELGKRTRVMGVVNVTPDSFSDGGDYKTSGDAVARALRLLEEGADIIDIGGESTRPGARVGMDHPAVTGDEEMRRILPVIVAVKEAKPDAIISVDTYKSKVAQAAVEAGAEIVNDVSGLQWDPKMKKTLAGLNCGVVIMHARGKPDEWGSLPAVPDMVMLVKRELRARAEAGMTAKIRRDRIVLDPGFGFGKRFEENYPLLRRFHEFHEVYFPLLAGVSRKSWIGRALSSNGKDVPVQDRDFGTLGAEVTLAIKGAHIVRTHNVKACVDALRVADLVAG
ncbi:MAG TPA: dihydropteroate synthase [Terriglobales bacterium]|nr:dihydropteroate synthase [Terriglobales bacterium]